MMAAVTFPPNGNSLDCRWIPHLMFCFRLVLFAKPTFFGRHFSEEFCILRELAMQLQIAPVYATETCKSHCAEGDKIWEGEAKNAQGKLKKLSKQILRLKARASLLLANGTLGKASTHVEVSLKFVCHKLQKKKAFGVSFTFFLSFLFLGAESFPHLHSLFRFVFGKRSWDCRSILHFHFKNLLQTDLLHRVPRGEKRFWWWRYLWTAPYIFALMI